MLCGKGCTVVYYGVLTAEISAAHHQPKLLEFMRRELEAGKNAGLGERCPGNPVQ